MSATPASDPSSAPPTAAGPSKLKVFGKRLISTLILWALLTISMIYKLGWPFHILVGVLGLGSLWEFLNMDRSIPSAQRRWIFGLGIFYFAGVFAVSEHVPFLTWELVDVAGAVLALTGVFIPAFLRPLEGQKTLWNIIYPAFGFFYIAFLFSFIPRILFGPWNIATPASGLFYGLFVVAATKFTDSGAYAIGSLIGKNKMIPHISPGKTWEGLGGAFLGSLLAGLGVKYFSGDYMPLLTYGECFGLCLIIAIVCVAGDLAESLIKRCLNVKDSGKTLPGIGGALDLTDSLLWTGPVVYLYLKYVG